MWSSRKRPNHERKKLSSFILKRRVQRRRERWLIILSALTALVVCFSAGRVFLYRDHGVQTPRLSAVRYYTCKIRNLDKRLVQAPTLLLAGAQKAGTSALGALLELHPNMVASRQEQHFFDFYYRTIVEQAKANGLHDEQSVLCHVREKYLESTDLANRMADMSAKRGTRSLRSLDRSPSHLLLPYVPQAVRMTLPWTKVVALLRNPVERFISHYNMQFRLGRTAMTVEEILDRELEVLHRGARTSLKDWRHSNGNFTIPTNPKPDLDDMAYGEVWYDRYLQRGMYSTQLRRWLQYYSTTPDDDTKGSILILPYEVFREYPELVYAKVLDFAGLPRIELLPASYKNRYKSWLEHQLPAVAEPEPISLELRLFLEKFYEPYNRELVDLLGENWKGLWDATNSSPDDAIARWQTILQT